MTIKKTINPLLSFFILQLAVVLPATATSNILYLNSTRGQGTGSRGNFRSTIADFIDNYEDGNVFDVDFVQTHVSGDLASFLNAKPIDYYGQIWFDTTISRTSLFNAADLDALNTWSINKQPEFILDSSFFVRNRTSNTMTASSGAVTVNQALALQDAGGGIFIGTDHNDFAYTANQVLANFGFDELLTGNHHSITSNGSFVGDSMLAPNSVGSDFFTNHLQGLSTSNVPIGTHVLNENGGNRTINIYENLFSYSPNKIAHIGTSFDPGNRLTDIRNPEIPESVPEPSSILGLFVLGGFGVRSLLLRISQ
ncbi:MAG: PEP-CTERM sorting domain-containing protein [Cyanobacteriota bacterium]|nr:PEP-CTERM sorting domain-containing protein [Cyanobacteriota bacterium]